MSTKEIRSSQITIKEADIDDSHPSSSKSLLDGKRSQQTAEIKSVEEGGGTESLLSIEKTQESKHDEKYKKKGYEESTLELHELLRKMETYILLIEMDLQDEDMQMTQMILQCEIKRTPTPLPRPRTRRHLHHHLYLHHDLHHRTI